MTVPTLNPASRTLGGSCANDQHLSVTPSGGNVPISLDPISEPSAFSMKRGSLNLPSQRKALALYNAPVVKECYKRVISHFNKPKNSFTQGQRLEPLQPTQIPPAMHRKQDSETINNHEFIAISATPREEDTGLYDQARKLSQGLVTKEDIDVQRKRMDLNAMTPNLISELERSEAASPVAEQRLINLSHRNSPNAEKLRAYFEAKGQQE